MKTRSLRIGLVTMFVLGTFASTTSFAERPVRGGGPGSEPPSQREQHADQPRGGRDQGYEQRDRQRSGERREDRTGARKGHESGALGFFFGEIHRTISRDYFRQHYSDNRCPPGLAKKRNGCMPPGIAKKWSMGHPLARGVIFHDLPPGLVERFGAPPPRHRYVRVDSDILLIEIGTGIVRDVIENLGW